MSDPMGLASARGTKGGWDTLNAILARQEIARQQALLEERQRAQDAGVIEDRRLRTQQAEDLRNDRRIDNERADRAEAAQTKLREEQAEKTRQAEEREAKRVANLEAIATDPNADPGVRRQAAAALMNRNGTVNTELFRDREAEHRRNVVEINVRESRRDARDEANDDRDAARDKDKTERDDPKAPRGVTDYLLTLKTKYPTMEDAVAELDRAWDDIRRAHPNADASILVGKLRGMYDRPRGAARPPITINPEGLGNR
jgi:hypothetical protein